MNLNGLFALFRSRSSWRKEEVERQADTLMIFLGDHAYTEARQRAREARAKADRAGDRLWSRVAVVIARRAGYVIGEKATDRYARDRPG